jgi:uncharacterized damage-inducible protein DinB
MTLVEIVRTQLVRELDGFVREVEACPDDVSLWAVAPGVTNSVGTLALHVSGNLQHFVGRVLGGSDYVRNREHEFTHRGASRADVVAELRRASAAVTDALGRVSPAQLDSDYPEPLGGHTVNTAQFLGHLGAHLAFHLGQAGYLRRVVTGSNTSTAPLPLAAIAR